MLIVATAMLSLQSCAKVSVIDRDLTQASVVHEMPDTIYIMDYFADTADFRVDREGDELQRIREETSQALSRILKERLNYWLAPTEIPQGSTRLPQKGWLVAGRFLKVDQGSRLLRLAIGFGAGATKMETETRLYDLSYSTEIPVLSFKTSGGTNAEPGVMISGLSSIALAGGGVGIISGLQQGVTADIVRTGEAITEELYRYLVTRGLLDKTKIPRKQRDQSSDRKQAFHTPAAPEEPSADEIKKHFERSKSE